MTKARVPKDQISRFKNPFVVESPEKLTPRQIVDLFVEQYTRIETVKQRRHTFIWGSRGSGKSMLLRYLEPQCQAIVHRRLQAFLSQSQPFLAVYCPCKEGQMNRTELALLDDPSLKIVTEHMLNMSIASRVINSLGSQFPTGFLGRKDLEGFCSEVTSQFDRASIASSMAQADRSVERKRRPLEWLDEVFEGESRRINAYLRDNALRGGAVLYEGATTGYHDFLLPLVRGIQQLLGIDDLSAYILLDDADRLTVVQQTIINTWIANRDQSALCVKVSARREEYKTLTTRDGGLIEQPHDYSEVDVDELYTRSQSDYFEKVKLISDRRLELSSIMTKDISTFLPTDPTEDRLLDECKKETALEWEAKGRPGRKNDYVNRYAVPRLFQRIGKRKKSYAGFSNLVHISSGVVRDFLEPCYLMLDHCFSKGQQPDEISSIDPNLQNTVIHRYSEDFLLVKLEDIRKDLPPEQWSRLEALRTLIESLGRLFYVRLHDPTASEERLFSFTIKNQLPRELDDVLKLGLRYRYFQLRTYSTKEGGGREPWYILNRRLCPALKLDPTGFEGRISMTIDLLKLACEDTEKFVQLRLRKKDDPKQLSLFHIEEASNQ